MFNRGDRGYLTTDQQALIRPNMDLVGAQLRKIYHRIPRHVDRQLLLQAGLRGLMRAAHNWRPGQSASFRTFATRRVRGEILDELREMDFLPRSLRKKGGPHVTSGGRIGDRPRVRRDWNNRMVQPGLDLGHLVARDAVAFLMPQLEPAERQLLEWYWLHEPRKTMRQIAQLAGLTESRISQRMATLLAKCRQLLEADGRSD